MTFGDYSKQTTISFLYYYLDSFYMRQVWLTFKIACHPMYLLHSYNSFGILCIHMHAYIRVIENATGHISNDISNNRTEHDNVCLTENKELSIYILHPKVRLRSMVDNFLEKRTYIGRILSRDFVITHKYCWGPFYSHGLTLIPAWISNHMRREVWEEINHPFTNFNGCTVEVWIG